MKSIIATVCVLYISGFGNISAQNTFQTTFSQRYDTTWSNSKTTVKEGGCAIYSLVEINGSYYTVGQDDWIDRLIGNSSSYTVHGGYFGSITKVSSSGSKVWSKVDLNSKYLNKVIKSSDNKLVVAGRSNDGCWTVCKVGKATISKIDTNGNVIWSKGYNGTGGFVDDFLDVVECENKDYLAVGYTDDNSQREQGLITRLDSNGNALWTNVYTTLGRIKQVKNLRNSTNCIIIASGGGVLKIDRNGNSIPGFKRFTADNVVQLPNGQLLFTSYVQSSGGTYTQRSIKVFKTDTSGNFISGFTYNTPAFSFAYAHKLTLKKDGTALLACFGMDQSTTGNVLDTYRNFIINIDQNMNVLWAKEYYYDQYLGANEHYDLVECSDKNVLFGGYYLRVTSNSSPSVLTKLDSSGTSTCLNSKTLGISKIASTISTFNALSFTGESIQMGSYYSSWRNNDQVLANPTCGINPTLEIEAGFDLENSGVTVFPNPSSGDFNITFNNNIQNARLQVVNALGSVIRTYDQLNSNSITIMSSTWTKGIYFISIIDEDHPTKIIRFVKN